MNYQINPEFIYAEEDNGELAIVGLSDENNEVIRLQGKLGEIFILIVEEGLSLEEIVARDDQIELADLEKFAKKLSELGVLSPT
ncbi:MAG: hypothetical protein CME64_17080 [Halobacteriovoraceae bacterium]|nr:hypothetical protein [Halobacteriovoraceae bacterium]|tara:strand:+ start:241407 stop:241658 length:252 start_codon:yes stop_codon:yes gene_type:complete